MVFGFFGGGGNKDKNDGKDVDEKKTASSKQSGTLGGQSSTSSSPMSEVPKQVVASKISDAGEKRILESGGKKGGGGGGGLGFFRGPKSILSTAIAAALDEYFVVDANHIESNLVRDARIVLRDVAFRQQTVELPGGKGGERRSLVAVVTGSVEEVVFSWSWSVVGGGGGESWVKDAALTISGLNLKATVRSVVVVKDDKDSAEAAAAKLQSSSSAKLQEAAKEAEVTKVGGLRAYIQRQVEIIIDALTLRVQRFRFEVDMPSSLALIAGYDSDDEEDGAAAKDASGDRTSIVAGGELVELLSSGRQANVSPDAQSGPLVQTCNLLGFYVDVVEVEVEVDMEAASPTTGAKDSVETDTAMTTEGTDEANGSNDEQTEETAAEKPKTTTVRHPLLEPFGYTASVVRKSGRRFGDVGTGLEVTGGPKASDPNDDAKGLLSMVESDASKGGDDDIIKGGKGGGGGLMFYVGSAQIEALLLLVSILVAPPSEEGANDEGADGNTAKVSPSNEEGTTIDMDEKLTNKTEGKRKDLGVADGGEKSPSKDISPSTFEFRLPSVSVVAKEQDSSVTASSLSAKYVADGSVMDVTVKRFELESGGRGDDGNGNGNGDSGVGVGADKDGDQGTIDREKSKRGEGDDGNLKAIASGLSMSMYPHVAAKIAFIETLRVPNVFELLAPMVDTAFEYEGTTLTLSVDTVKGLLPNNDDCSNSTNKAMPKETSGGGEVRKHNEQPETTGDEDGKDGAKPITDGKSDLSTPPSSSSGSSFGFTTPIPLKLSLKRVTLQTATVEKLGKPSEVEGGEQKAATATTTTTTTTTTAQENEGGKAKEEETENRKVGVTDLEAPSMEVEGLELYLHPESNPAMRTQVALRVGRAKNNLALVNNGNLCVTLPPAATTSSTFPLPTLDDLSFSSDSIVVTAGMTAEDWANTFHLRRRNKNRRTKAEKPPPTPVYACPRAEISPLRLKVTYATGVGISVKDSAFVIKAYKGKEHTTSKDLITYYTRACLGRVPGFISNAEVLGLNVVDSTASTYGAWLGMATPLGLGGGLAAIAAVDAVKGTVAAGKRSRHAEDGEPWRPLDLVRGVAYAAREAARDGKARRGKGDGTGGGTRVGGVVLNNFLTDWAVGTTAGMGEYVDENKSRLGAAGGAGAGMVVGTVLGGPIGGILGGVLSGAVTGKTIKGIEKKQDAKHLGGTGRSDRHLKQ